MTTESPDTAARDRKALLYCPDCGYASPVDGDWTTVTDPDGVVVYRCPDCGRAIERRPAFPEAPTVSACD